MGQWLEKLRVAKQRPPSPQWERAWRELTRLTSNLEKTDSRHELIVYLLEECDRAFENDYWLRFQEAARKVKWLVQKSQ